MRLNFSSHTSSDINSSHTLAQKYSQIACSVESYDGSRLCLSIFVLSSRIFRAVFILVLLLLPDCHGGQNIEDIRFFLHHFQKDSPWLSNLDVFLKIWYDF